MSSIPNHIGVNTGLQTVKNTRFLIPRQGKVQPVKSVRILLFFFFCSYLNFIFFAVLETEPALPCEKSLAEKLETTQDTQGFISHIRKLFIQMSDKKTKHATNKKISKKS
jgi:hypothetical protein